MARVSFALRSLVLPVFLAWGCGPARPVVNLEAFMQVGVDPSVEADRVEARLVRGGWTRDRRVAHRGIVALAFSRAPEGRAVRIVTRRGVVAALDSHEPDGLFARHGAVRLADRPMEDVTGDGRAEILVARDEADGTVCLAILACAEDGTVREVPNEATALHDGACPHRFEDIDASGAPEALVPVRFMALRLGGSPPEIEVPLTFDGTTFRAIPAPISYVEAQQARRLAALIRARAEHDAAAIVRLAVEVAALAQLAGAAPSAQALRFDEAIEGLALSTSDTARVAAIRQVIHDGWPAPPE